MLLLFHLIFSTLQGFVLQDYPEAFPGPKYIQETQEKKYLENAVLFKPYTVLVTHNIIIKYYHFVICCSLNIINKFRSRWEGFEKKSELLFKHLVICSGFAENLTRQCYHNAVC